MTQDAVQKIHVPFPFPLALVGGVGHLVGHLELQLGFLVAGVHEIVLGHLE